jgi:hypothetical protein
MPAVSMEEESPSVAKAIPPGGPIMYGLKPVPFKDDTLLFLELWSTGFAVISVHQRGMEIAQIRPSPILFRQ